ncbi:MAG: hypothetical protein ACP5S8_01140 [Hydrogenobaculum sp.]
MGKIIFLLLIFIFSCVASAEGEYQPKITFRDIVESQIGVIKKVVDLNKKTKELSKNLEKEKKKVEGLDQNVTKLQEQQQLFSKKLEKIEKEVRDLKLEHSIKGLVIESESSKKSIGFGKPYKRKTVKELIKNGPENIYFCVDSLSYIRKYPSIKSVAIGASYKGDTLQCLTPCGLEGHRFYWLHILNLRTGYKGYSILNSSIKEGKCK